MRYYDRPQNKGSTVRQFPRAPEDKRRFKIKMKCAKQSVINATRLLRILTSSRVVIAVTCVLMLMTSCRAALILPALASSGLAANVSVTCGGGGGGGGCLGPPVLLDQQTCVSQNVCTLLCPVTSRQHFPPTEIPLNSSWTASPSSTTAGCDINTAPPSDAPSQANNVNGFLNVSSTASCTVSSNSAATTSGRLALSLWVLPACTKNCTIAGIVQGSDSITLFVKNGKLCVNSICGSTDYSAWTHIILQISAGKATIAVNGVFPASGGVSYSVASLSAANVSVTVGAPAGVSAGDNYQLFDVHYYSDTLTVREIGYVYTNTDIDGSIPLSECRCPHTHLTLASGDGYTCSDSDGATTKRLVTEFFPPATLIDGNTNSSWVGPDSGNFQLTVDLKQDYQVEYVVVHFGSTRPGDFALSSQGKALTCSDTTCSLNTSLTPSTPGVNPQMFAEYVKREVTLTFDKPGPNIVLSSIVVTGRCNCNGNAGACDMRVDPYECTCDINTHTQGRQCEMCDPDQFHNTNQFDCQGTCDCDTTGVRDLNQTCDMNTGACLCKDNVEGNRCDTCKRWTYNLTSEQPLGCLHCPCHQNGSLSDCDKTTGACTCKPNVVPPNCDACALGFYDLSQFAGPTPCQTCGCDTAGTRSGNTVCNQTTGQCECKDNVQGRNCSVCTDGFYDLQLTTPQGCLPCDCNLIGSTSHVCDKTSGQCPCLTQAENNRNCSPKITGIDPVFGPMAGGTLVTITGQLLGQSNQTPNVYLGLINQTVKHSNSTVVVFETKSSQTSAGVRVLVNWDSSTTSLTTDNFTFRPDPVLDRGAIPKVSMFTSGGCSIQFAGTNFNSVAFPRLVVRNVAANTTVTSPCRHVRQKLQCTGPQLSPINSGGSNFRFGLELDGIVDYDLGPVEVRKDPTLDFIGTYDLQYPFEDTVIITGTRLMGGCPQDEISILIGVVSCDIVRMSDSEIECEPPNSLHGTKGSAIMVKVGNNIAKQVGTLNYLEIYETSYFIGIMCGIGALILLIVFIVVLVRCRRNKKMISSNRQSQMQLVEKPANGGPTPQNDYSELPQNGGPNGGQNGGGTTNNGFGTLIRAETVIREPKEALPPTAREVDTMTDLFLHRVEPSLWEAIKAAIVTSSDLTLGRVCTNRGQYARIIDGQFATQRAGQRTEKKVTIKTLKEALPQETDMLPKWASAALKECLRLHRYGNDNVLSIMGLALDQQRFHIIYPYMQNRTLKDHIIDETKEFNVRLLVEYGLQVAEGLAFLHGKDIVHRDLAARNCMVDGADVVKISDAAFAWDFYEKEYIYDDVRERYIPVRWMAPESLTDGYYNTRTDVWSVGVILWELLTRGCLPFHEVEDSKVKPYITEGYMLGHPENCSDHLYHVMKECWNGENEQRPSVTEVVRMLSEDLTGGGVEQDDIYVNLGTVEGLYENNEELNKPRRKAPLPPRA